MAIETWEYLSYVVTVLGLPLAIAIFVYEKRRERQAEEEEVYEALSSKYHDFLRLALENPDLKLLSTERTADQLDAEQRERMLAIFGLLIALFERAYLLLYEAKLSAREARRWRSWEDFMQEWCARQDFREAMPELLQGEDPEFAAYLRKLVESAERRAPRADDPAGKEADRRSADAQRGGAERRAGSPSASG